MSTTTPNERIKMILENENCTIHQLAGGSSTILQKLYRQINVGKPLSADVLNLVMTNFPQYDPMWILNGDGEPTFDKSKSANLSGNSKPNVFDTELFGSGEPGTAFDAVTQNQMNGYVSLPDSPSNVFYIKSHGDSMTSCDKSQSIPDGAFVAIKKVSKKYFRWGEVYAICTPDGYFVKKIMPSEKDDNIKCVSLNSDKYPPFDMPLDEVTDVALVVGVVYGSFWN